MDHYLRNFVRRTDGRSQSIDPVELLRASMHPGGPLLRLTRRVRDRFAGPGAAFVFEEAHPSGNGSDCERLQRLRECSNARLAAAGDSGGLVVLLTGATGFIGTECVQRFAGDSSIRRVYCLVRPKPDAKSRTPDANPRRTALERGCGLLDDLRVPAEQRAKFEFLEGDVEAPLMGLGDRIAALASEVTHLVHSAASVAFDEPYEQARRSNVDAVANALQVSLAFHRSDNSRFVAHIALETAFAHGRTLGVPAIEQSLAFPPGRYNNNYELTKAIGSVVARRFMLEQELPLVQLLPTIVVGRSPCGSNHGDRKVLNAPINALAMLAASANGDSPLARFAARRLVVFPAHSDAELNLVGVDRVADAVVAALHRTKAIGLRIHLGAASPVSLGQLACVARDEFQVYGRTVPPSVFFAIVKPFLGIAARTASDRRVRRVLGGVAANAALFQAYTERPQACYTLANDREALGLGPSVPSEDLVRSLCRHSRYVILPAGRAELATIEAREETWRRAVARVEERLGLEAARIPGAIFHAEIPRVLDLATFELR